MSDLPGWQLLRNTNNLNSGGKAGGKDYVPSLAPMLLSSRRSVAKRFVELHAEYLVTALDFVNALKKVIGAPDWHGGSVDAFLDSLIYHDDIDALRLRNSKALSSVLTTVCVELALGGAGRPRLSAGSGGLDRRHSCRRSPRRRPYCEVAPATHRI
jgi:hypothetical protein